MLTLYVEWPIDEGRFQHSSFCEFIFMGPNTGRILVVFDCFKIGKTMHISLSLRWQLENKTSREIEENLFLLLHAVRRDLSLKKASTELGFSYRYAWGLLKRWPGLNQIMPTPKY